MNQSTTARRNVSLQLAMPVIVIAFATYLLIGLITMRVPEGTDFPGPRFFPIIITAGLYLFAILLILETLAAKRRSPQLSMQPVEQPVAQPLDPPLEHGRGTPYDAGHDTRGDFLSDSETPVNERGVVLVTDDGAENLGNDARGISWSSFAWVVVPFIGFALLLPLLGWIVAAALLFWCVARSFGSDRVLGNMVVGLTVGSLTYILFDMLLGLTLPSGILGWGF